MTRPDGTNQLYAGWSLLSLGVISIISGVRTEVSMYDPGSGELRLVLIASGAGLAGIAFSLLLTGWIIRAIFFLPAKEDAIRTTDQPTLNLDSRHEVEPTGRH